VRVAVAAAQATRMQLRVGGRLLAADTRAPFRGVVARSRLAKRATLMRVHLTYGDGREQSLDRRLRRCS